MQYNVLRSLNGQPVDYMLGCSCDKLTAERYAAYYNRNHPHLKASRARNGYDTPDWTYEAVQVDFDNAKWFPVELAQSVKKWRDQAA